MCSQFSLAPKIKICIAGIVFWGIIFIIFITCKFGREFDRLNFKEYNQFKIELEEKYVLLELKGTIHEGTGISFNVYSKEMLDSVTREKIAMEIKNFFKRIDVKTILEKKYSTRNMPIKVNNIYFKYRSKNAYIIYHEIDRIN